MSDARDPIARLREALARAAAAGPFDPTAAALATADASGRPSVRVVLVKRVDERGLAFFTNRESRKGRALGEQVRAEGPVSPLPDADSDAYFATRPRESQVGAWAWRQSAPLPSREALLAAAAAAEARFTGGAVARPPHWGGYLLVPEAMEFWRSGEGRLHHRTLYARTLLGWSVSLLGP